jgi:hypothetical protein
MSQDLIERAEKHDYQKLFLHDLNWSRPDQQPVTVEYDGRTSPPPTSPSTRASASGSSMSPRLLARGRTRPAPREDQHRPHRHLPRRARTGLALASAPGQRQHHHHPAQPPPAPHRRHRPRFADKLDVIRLPFDVTLDANAVLAKVRQAFDVEAHNETKHASKLMARLYAAMEKAYPPRGPQGPRPRDLRDPRPHPLPDVRRRHRDVAHRPLPGLHPATTPPDGTDIGPTHRPLHYLDTPTPQRAERLRRVPYVNGGSSPSESPCPFSTPSSVPLCSTRATVTGRPSAQPSSAPCSSPCATPRPAASSASTTPPRRTSSRPSTRSSSTSSAPSLPTSAPWEV